MGAEQLAWFKAELLRASADHVLLVWVCEFPWAIGDRKWGWFEPERRQVLSFVATHGLRHKILILSGDAHMLAIDDGRFSPGGIPVLHASPLARMGSYKGGPYAYGAVAVEAEHGQGAYGLLTISDRGLDVQRTCSARDLESFQDRTDLERKRRKRASLTQRASSKLGLTQATDGDASLAAPPARAGRDALAAAASAVQGGSIIPTTRLASLAFGMLGLSTGEVTSAATAALAVAAGSPDVAALVARQGGVSQHLEGGGARPAHVATAAAWTGVCITARGIVSDGTAVRGPSQSVGHMGAVTHGSPLSVAGEALRWDTCRPQTSSQLAPHYPPLSKPGEWAPLYAYSARACSTQECDVEGTLDKAHPLAGVKCPGVCLQAVQAGSTFSGWDMHQSAPPLAGLLASAAVVEQQHLNTAWCWAAHWLLTPLSKGMTYIMSPLHTYSQRLRFVPDTSVAWLSSYYIKTRAIWNSKSGEPAGMNTTDTKLAQPWLARPAASKPALHFISLRNMTPDFARDRISLGFHDLRRAALRSLGGAVSAWELLQHLLQVTRSSPSARGVSAKWLQQVQGQDALVASFSNASFVTSDGRRLEAAAHSSLSRFHLRAAAALDSWAAFDPRAASTTFTIVFMSCILLLFVAVQGMAGFCAIQVLPRLCCGSRQMPQPEEEAESAEAAAYNKWYRQQQQMSQRQQAAAMPEDFRAAEQNSTRHRGEPAVTAPPDGDHAASTKNKPARRSKKRQ